MKKHTKKKATASLQSRLVGKTNTETLAINGIACIVLLISGSVISSISEEFYEKYLNMSALRPIS